MARLRAANLAQTTLSKEISNTATSLDVFDSSGFPTPPFRITIENEILEVTNVSGNTFTVVRGVEGTTSAAHPYGAEVENRFTAGTYAELVSQDELTSHKNNASAHHARYTDAEAVQALKNHDGTGINADTVDGKHASAFANASHTHDDRYYTESEVDSKLANKANANHTHMKSQITDFSHTHTASDLPNASTSAKGVVQLSDSVSDTSTTLAATTNAVKKAYDLAASKANASHTHTKSQITDFSHTHTSADLPTASISSTGIVQLTTSTSSASTTLAATASAVKTVNDKITSHTTDNAPHTYGGRFQWVYNPTTDSLDLVVV